MTFLDFSTARADVSFLRFPASKRPLAAKQNGVRCLCQQGGSHLSHKKKVLLSIESWLFNRDPHNGLLQSPI